MMTAKISADSDAIAAGDSHPTDSPSLPSPNVFDWIFPVLIGAVVILIPAIRALNPIYDPDVWWHLRTGEWILENRAFPETDPFSRLGIEESRRWYAPGWLWEATLAKTHEFWGAGAFAGIAWVSATAIVLATLAACYQLSGRFLLSAAWAGAAAFALNPIINVRSYMVSNLIATVVFWILLDHRRTGRTRMLWIIPPLFALWSNLHIQILYGYFLLVVAAFEPMGIWMVRRLGGSLGDWKTLVEPASSAKALMAVLVGSVAASVCNPYGFAWWLVIIDHIQQTGQFQWLNELNPPHLLEPYYAISLVMALFAIGTLVRKRVDDSFLYVVLGVSVVLLLRAQRDVWFPAMASALGVAFLTGHHREMSATRLGRNQREWLRPLLAAGLAALAIFASGKLQWLSADVQDREIAKRFPVKAVKAIQERGWAGPLYNHLNWGGYLMWALPDYPVAVDGRANAHGDRDLKRSYDSWSGLNAWRDDPLLQTSNLAIARPDSPLTSILRLAPHYLVVYEDEVAVVFLKTVPLDD